MSDNTKGIVPLLDEHGVQEPVIQHIASLYHRLDRLSVSIRKMVEDLTVRMLTIKDEDQRDALHLMISNALIDTVAKSLAAEAISLHQDESKLRSQLVKTDE